MRLTDTAPLPDGEMIAAWMIQSGQPVDPVYEGGPHQTLGRIRAGVELTLADKQGRMITRTLSYGDAAALAAALGRHVDNVAPHWVHPDGTRR
jgi:hypothetical protein